MKKFSVWMVLIVVVAAVLSACQPAPVQENTTPTPCTKVISIEALKEYAGQKVIFINSYRGVTELQIGNQMVCVSQNGLGNSWDGDEEEKIVLEVKTDDPSGGETILGTTKDCYYDYCESADATDILFFSGMSGTLSFGNGREPRIVMDKVVPTFSHNESCTTMEQDKMGSLDGKKVKIVGYSKNNELVLESGGKKYCFSHAGWMIDVYKTIDIGGQPYHVKANLDRYATMSFVNGSTGIFSVTYYKNGVIDTMRIDIGEGEDVESGVDPMIEEIAAHKAWYYYRPALIDNDTVRGGGNETIPHNYGGELPVLAVYTEEPTLQPGYMVSPKAYVYGGPLSIGKVIGLMDDDPESPVTLESVTGCQYGESSDPWYAKYHFYVTTPYGMETSLNLAGYMYIAMFRGNGDGQTITYYKVDASVFCPVLE